MSKLIITNQHEICEDSNMTQQIERVLLDSERRYRLLAESAADTIWTVYKDMHPTYISPSYTHLLGYSVEETITKTVKEVFTPVSYEIFVGVLAEELARESEEQTDLSWSRNLELDMVRKDGSNIPVEIKFSFLRVSDDRPIEILAITHEISARRQAEDEAKRSTDKLLKAMESMMQAMAMIIEMRDPYTAGHQRRVTQLACAIAREMDITVDQITGLRLAGLIHDIGKVRVPAEILTHPDGLTDAEFTMIKMHPILGYEILVKMDLPWPIAQIVYQHHERLNGSGYPLGLPGEEIILEARILAVADVVEAIASHRPYRPAQDLDKALDEIVIQKNILYDPKVVDACLKLFEEKQFKLG
ncbi:HD domain-containing phosphohydrolase [Chloroflexota bacterium]